MVKTFKAGMSLAAPVLIIDGDIVAYRAAAATDGRCYSIKYVNDDGDTVTVYEKYKKDADKMYDSLVNSGENISQEVTLEFHPEPEEYALHLVDKLIQSLETSMGPWVTGIGPVEVFLSEGKNFRNDILASYKANRDDLRRPTHLSACKQHMLNKYKALVKPGELEADDLMAMRATECMNNKVPYIIVTVDKDLLQVPGHHWNLAKDEMNVTDEVEGTLLLYKQMLTGDAVDGIPGLKGVGPKTADKLLHGITSEWNMYLVVLKEYVRRNPNMDPRDVQKVLHIHASLLYLLRAKDEHWKAPTSGGI